MIEPIANDIQDILDKHGFTFAEVQSRQRDARLIACKKEIAQYLRDKGYSYPRIGNFMNKNHTSVMNLLGVLGKNKKN